MFLKIFLITALFISILFLLYIEKENISDFISYNFKKVFYRKAYLREKEIEENGDQLFFTLLGLNNRVSDQEKNFNLTKEQTKTIQDLNHFNSVIFNLFNNDDYDKLGYFADKLSAEVILMQKTLDSLNNGLPLDNVQVQNAIQIITDRWKEVYSLYDFNPKSELNTQKLSY